MIPVDNLDVREIMNETENTTPEGEFRDQKLQELIDQMESALSQGGTPNFKLFWDLRKGCLELFKENISPAMRTLSWARYRELSKEAKKLKDLFDEQSAFAVEQIEIAIKALEIDIESIDQQLEKMDEVDFGPIPKSFGQDKAFYAKLQKKLNLLNAHASRVNTMRKELIKTEMRIKHKNNFFERLSKAGDKIFPDRKELIKEVSDRFENDIEAFVTKFFGDNKEFVPTYYLRDDIKTLQNIAKILTLNSAAFSSSRQKLSECWDALKQMDKERKKEIQVKREGQKKSFDETIAKIDEAALAFSENQINETECLERAEAIFKELRSLDLGKEESKPIKDKLQALKKSATDKLKEKQDERDKIEREKRFKRQEALLELQRRVQDAMSGSHAIEDLKALEVKIGEEASEYQGKEGLELAKKLKAFQEYIEEKEEEALILNSSEGQDSLKALRDILEQKKKRRSEIKNEIEKLRKTSAISGFDFENAFKQNDQIEIERERLEKADLAISEIEEKIKDVKARLRKES